MAPAAQSEQADISLASNPIFGMQNMKAVLRFLKIIVGGIFFCRPVGIMTRARGWKGSHFYPSGRVSAKVVRLLNTVVGPQRPFGLYYHPLLHYSGL